MTVPTRRKPKGNPRDEYTPPPHKPGLLENRDPRMQSVQPPEAKHFAKPKSVGTKPVKPRHV